MNPFIKNVGNQAGILSGQSVDSAATAICGVRWNPMLNKWMKSGNAQGLFIGSGTVVLNGFVNLFSALQYDSATYFLDASGNLVTNDTGIVAGHAISNTTFYVEITGIKNIATYTTQSILASGNWTVPVGVTNVDVFLVGGGGGGGDPAIGGTYFNGGGGGYTKVFKTDSSGYKDGSALTVTPGAIIPVVVGAGGTIGASGGYSEFLNSTYRTLGGLGGTGTTRSGGGGSGGGAGGAGSSGIGGSDGSAGGDTGNPNYGGAGQGHTTRAFGDAAGTLYAGGGGGGCYNNASTAAGGAGGGGQGHPSASAGSTNTGGGGGGGSGMNGSYVGKPGGSGIILVRWRAYP